jgi:hypothetical protein
MSGVLTDRAVIAVAGPEAKSFLQGLITSDMGKLAPDAPLYAALLTPQGKVLFDFLLSEHDGGVFLDCAAALSQTLLKRLTLYRLRAKVELSLRDTLAVLWNDGGWSDPRLAELGTRRIVEQSTAVASTEYLSHRLSLGLPEGADFGSDKMFALDAGLEELHGVSFDKGCYVGQELTARMKHRGTARKRLLPVTASDGQEMPAAGTEIRAGESNIGEITSTYGDRGFALIRLDRWQEAGTAHVRAGGRDICIERPAWLTGASAP